tara:strand:- start:26 stop:622 length:597 start_codon:yes stop_codon:yes gene_type:complete
MKFLFYFPIYILSSFIIQIFICLPIYAGDFQKGVDAANNGDYATAYNEWRPLAEQGDPSSQFNLGWMYVNGYGVIQDYKEAANWYLKSAEQGIAEAQLEIGLMYNEGKGVIQDEITAANWFLKSAEQGNAQAQYNLGWFYTARNIIYAHMWWNIAAFNGYPYAAELRDIRTEEMSLSQIEEAQKLARECLEKNYKGCI